VTPARAGVTPAGREAIALGCPVRLLHGMSDASVPRQTSLSLAERLASHDVVVTLIKNGDHRLSREADLLVHDERNPALAYLIARLGPPRFPTPIGVFTAVERPRYEEALNRQVAAAKAKAPADLRALLDRGDTWVVS